MERSVQFQPKNPRAGLAKGQPGDRLDSWKDIASYLGRSEKTVQRWEEGEQLPVHRLVHEKRGSVYAYTSELEAWREARKASIEPSAAPNESRLRNLTILKPASQKEPAAAPVAPLGEQAAEPEA